MLQLLGLCRLLARCGGTTPSSAAILQARSAASSQGVSARMRMAGYQSGNDRAHVNASLTSPTHPCHTQPIHGSSREKHVMTKVPSANLSPELVTIMKSALDDAFHRIDRSHRTPATKAKMAQRIIRTASEGVTDLHVLMSAAVDEGRVPAA